LLSEAVKLTDEWTKLSYRIPDSISYIKEVGIQLTALKRTAHTSIWMDYLNADGEANLIMDFSKLPMEDYGLTHGGQPCKEVAGATRHSGKWISDETGLHNLPEKSAMIVFGDYFWQDGTIDVTFDKFGVGSTFLFRVQGARKWYGIARTSQINFELRKCDGVISTLESFTFENTYNGRISLHINLSYTIIKVEVSGHKIQYSDEFNPNIRGCLGLIAADGALMSLKGIKISLT